MSDDEQFEATGADSADTVPKQASAMRKNGYCMLKNHPCKIVEMSTSKTGKHGHAKIHFVGIDIFSGKKYEDISPSTHTMQEPIFKRCEMVVTDMDDDGFFSLMNDVGEMDDSIQRTDECEQTKEEIKKKMKECEDDSEIVATVFECLKKKVVKKVDKRKIQN